MLQCVAPDGLGCGLGDIWNFSQDNGGFLTELIRSMIRKKLLLSLYKWFLTRAVPTDLFSISGRLPVMYLLVSISGIYPVLNLLVGY